MTREELRAQAFRSGVPNHTVDTLVDYVFDRCPVGSFTEAVLSNDLKGSFMRADDINRDALFNIVSFLYSYATMDCWGSSEKYKAWINKEGA